MTTTNKLNIEPHRIRRDVLPERLYGYENQPGKFKNKYRIPSARLKNYDYSSNGAYFITICTKNREHFFGEITDGKIQLSEIGEIANDCWKQIPQHFSFVQLGEFVIMSNHVHGILIIDNNNDDSIVETPKLGVSTNANRYWKSGNLGVVINQYKRICTITIRKIFPNFAWQSRFYDHIVRSEEELYRISEYIIKNPKNWQTDDYYLPI